MGTLESGVTVVLTATIDPRLILYTRRSDPSVRLKDYQNSLRLWLADKSVTKIVFCENSGSDLTSLRNLWVDDGSLTKEVEFLSLHGQDFDPGLGKSFGEMGILAHVVANSKLLRSSSHIVKVTGRLYVKNAGKLLQRIADKNSIDVFCNLFNNLRDGDGRVFSCNGKFLQECLVPMCSVANESCNMNFERVLARAVHQGLASGMRWSLLPVTPRVSGISGTLNQDYNASYAYWLSRECFRQLKSAVLAR